MFVTAFISMAVGYLTTIDFSNKIEMSSEYWLLIPAFVIRAFIETILYASLMFTGSAFLYRVDKFLEAAE
jgi:uncharacterized protein (UPF0333 family)